MIIKSRKGCGRVSGFHVCAVGGVAKIVYEKGGEWFMKSFASAGEATVTALGKADDVIVLSDGKAIKILNGEITSVETTKQTGG